MPPDNGPSCHATEQLSRRGFLAATGALVLTRHLPHTMPSSTPTTAHEPDATRDSDPSTLSLEALALAIRSGKVSSQEAVRACLERIDAVNPAINAVVQVQRERALADARTADRAPRDRRRPLHGVPVTFKDSLDTTGIITTYGTTGRATVVPTSDATVVARLRSAGAIILGKTNTPELTLSLETDNQVYGRTNNPYDLTRTTGGSSGGAAAIVSAGGSPLDIGSDTGGSIRFPAHCCGVAGLKPTAGRVPRTGHAIAFDGVAESLTVLGPIARRVDDLAFVLPIIAGPDGVDPHVVPVPVPDHRKVRVPTLRVGVFTALGDLAPSAETVQAVERSGEALARAGCKVAPVVIPDAAQTTQRYLQFLYADGGASVIRKLDQLGTGESLLRTRMQSLKPVETVAAFLAAQEELDRWRSRMLSLFADSDVLVCPVYPTPAPKHGQVARAQAGYMQLFNLTGWPAVVLRAGTSPEGLPIGAQCVAPPWREDIALAVAHHLESALGPWPAPGIPPK